MSIKLFKCNLCIYNYVILIIYINDHIWWLQLLRRVRNYKRTYKKLAVKWHPNKNPGNPSATEKFQRISHAYTILSDPKKKSYYDKYGKIDEDDFNFEEFMKNFNFDFGDLFKEFGKNGIFV